MKAALQGKERLWRSEMNNFVFQGPNATAKPNWRTVKYRQTEGVKGQNERKTCQGEVEDVSQVGK